MDLPNTLDAVARVRHTAQIERLRADDAIPLATVAVCGDVLRPCTSDRTGARAGDWTPLTPMPHFRRTLPPVGRFWSKSSAASTGRVWRSRGYNTHPRLREPSLEPNAR